MTYEELAIGDWLMCPEKVGDMILLKCSEEKALILDDGEINARSGHFVSLCAQDNIIFISDLRFSLPTLCDIYETSPSPFTEYCYDSKTLLELAANTGNIIYLNNNFYISTENTNFICFYSTEHTELMGNFIEFSLSTSVWYAHSVRYNNLLFPENNFISIK